MPSTAANRVYEPAQGCDSRGTLELEIRGASGRASASANRDGPPRQSSGRARWTPDSRTRANRLFLVCCEKSAPTGAIDQILVSNSPFCEIPRPGNVLVSGLY